MTALCPRTDLPPEWCACPDHRGEPEPVPPLDGSRPIPDRSWPAKYPGVCGDCGGQIEVGEPIIREGAGRYVHEVCPD